MLVENLDIELGYRNADYDIQGGTDSWKAGISWEIVPGFRVRAMQQQAVRVANVGELFRPVTTGLDNATFDPCSVGNPNPPAPGSELFNRCVATGMLPTRMRCRGRKKPKRLHWVSSGRRLSSGSRP